MENFRLDSLEEFDDDLNLELLTIPKRRTKPVKRKWREIDKMLDRRKLLHELQELDSCSDYKLEDINL